MFNENNHNMKKILGLALASAFLLPACEDELDIPQKGVTTVENFYQTDEEAESAMVAAYQGFLWNICSREGGSIYAPFRMAFNLCGDDVFAAGAFLGDNDALAALNEFRYDSGNDVITNAYGNIYYAMYYSNLVIDHFKDGLPNGGGVTATTKRVVAEARVLRAYMHMMLAIGWGTPPLVDHVLGAYDKPANVESQESLIKWCAQECEAAAADLAERKSTTDKDGVAVVTKGFAQAVAGKCYLFLKDYANAKTALKKVIDSGKYALAANFEDLFHQEGDLNEEKIFEANFDMNDNAPVWWDHINRSTWMEANLWNWRTDHFVSSPTATYSSIDGWGGCGVPTDFAKEFVENDGLESQRLNASIIKVDDVVYNYCMAGQDMTLEAKKTDKDKVGILPDGLYGQSLYLPLKPICKKTDLTSPGTNCRLNNFTIMRYAEVLLMYAEACVQTGAAGEALPYVNAIQKRANSKTISTAVDMNVIKKEKKLELWLEGCRWADMKRWGDLDVAKNAGKNVTSVYDKLTREIKGSDKVVEQNERFYSVYAPEAAGRATGFQAGKHEFFPFPNTVTSINPNLKQNPGW